MTRFFSNRIQRRYLSDWKEYDMGRVWHITLFARSEYKRIVANRCAAEFMRGSWWILAGIAIQVFFQFAYEWLPTVERFTIYTVIWIVSSVLISPLCNDALGEPTRGFITPAREELKTFVESKLVDLRRLTLSCAVLLGVTPFLDPALPEGGGEPYVLFLVFTLPAVTALVHTRALARWIICNVSEETSNELSIFEQTDAPLDATGKQKELFHVKYENRNLTGEQ